MSIIIFEITSRHLGYSGNIEIDKETLSIPTVIVIQSLLKIVYIY